MEVYPDAARTFIFKAILAIDAVAPIWAEEALASCIGALTS